MATRYRTLWTLGTPSIPLHDQARGGRKAKEYVVRNVANAEDTLMGHGRRVLMREGLRGAGSFSMPDGVDVGIGAYPDKTTAREVNRVTAKLSPGHFLAWSVLACPTGPTESGATDTGKYGSVKLSINWTSPYDTESTEHELTFLASQKADGGLASLPQTNWNLIHRRSDSFILPEPNASTNLTLLKKWSQDVEVEMVLEYIGGVRIVDLCVYERPIRFAGDTTADAFPVLCHTSGGEPKALLENPYPVEQIDETAVDPTQGSKQILETARLMAQYGPAFFNLGAYQEGTTTVFETQPAPFSTTSTSWVEIRTGSSLDNVADANRPGVSGSSGSTSLLIRLAGLIELRAKSGATPVRVRVYARGEGALRVRCRDYTMVEVPIDSVSYAWFESVGTLRCGIVGDDPSTWEVVVRATVGTLEVLYASVTYEETIT